MKTKIFEIDKGYCETHLCREKANYVLGREDVRTHARLHLCHKHASEVFELENIPKEFKKKLEDEILKKNLPKADEDKPKAGYKCPECGEIVNTEMGLKRHLNLKHGTK